MQRCQGRCALLLDRFRLNYMDRAGNVGAWSDFMAEVVRAWGDRFSALQVTGEPNLTGFGTDGDFPHIGEALVRGVITAASVKREHGATVEVGFAAAFEPRPEVNPLWPQVRQIGGNEFCDALDYGGIDMYPDVFGPRMTLERLGDAVGLVLKAFRERILNTLGIAQTVPLHICENGWPTGDQRSPEHQADALETIVRNVHAMREQFNVTHWELFTLRDADSSKDDLFHQFGILRDDYAPKPAFDRLVRLYAELG